MNKSQLNQKVGKRIAEVREKKGLSQAELARAINKDPQTLNRIEKGGTNPTVWTLYEIAEALEVNVVELVRI